MGFWSERKSRRDADLVSTLATALGLALGKTFEAQAHQLETSSKFLDTLQDLSARKAAQILGSKGGRVSQQRKRAAAKREKPTGCALCADPMTRNVSIESIRAHRLHEAGVDEAGADADGEPGVPTELGN